MCHSPMEDAAGGPWGPGQGHSAVRSQKPWQGKKWEETKLLKLALEELTSHVTSHLTRT